MAFINSLKRAFGLDDDLDRELAVDDDEPTVDDSPRQASQEIPVVEVRDTDITALSAEIFAGVVELFNSTQPEFVKNCLDTQAQKTYILDNINSAVRASLDAAVENSRARGQALWEEERRRLGNEVETLRKEKKALEQNREESKTARLSAERQKRALTERVHDLETQILTLQADKEQYMLENRSMLNKLRVASVTGNLDDEEIVEKIQELTESLEKAQTEVQQLRSANEKAMADVETARKEAEEARKSNSVDNAETELAAAKADVHNAMMHSLLEKLAVSHKETETLRAELDNALADTDSIMELKTQMDRVQGIIDKKDARIAALKKDLQQDVERLAALNRERDKFKSEIADLKAEIEQLNATIAGNLADNARLLKEKHRTESTDNSRKSSSKKSSSKPRISAIDELIDSTDWLVAAPPKPIVKETDKDDDFGYKAPQRKPHADDDKQLSLW